MIPNTYASGRPDFIELFSLCVTSSHAWLSLPLSRFSELSLRTSINYPHIPMLFELLLLNIPKSWWDKALDINPSTIDQGTKILTPMRKSSVRAATVKMTVLSTWSWKVSCRCAWRRAAFANAKLMQAMRNSGGVVVGLL